MNDDRVDDIHANRWNAFKNFEGFYQYSIDELNYLPDDSPPAIVHALLLISDRIKENTEVLKKMSEKNGLV